MKTPLHPVGDWQAMEPVAATKEIQKNKLVETYRHNPVREQRYLDIDKLQNQNPRKKALEVVGAR
jgi:hypothetical protein